MSIIVDIDGTLADNSHRQHLIETEGWDVFFSECYHDIPIEPIVSIVQILEEYHSILIVTGRPEKYKALTRQWLDKNGIRFLELYMRKDGDHRPDYEVKQEMLVEIKREYDPLLVIDDSPKVVKMWRDNGLICLQNEGCTK